jgi:hypothetical protein
MQLNKLRIPLAVGFLFSLAVVPAHASTITGYCGGTGTGCTEPSTAWSAATTGISLVNFTDIATDTSTTSAGITDSANPGATFIGVGVGENDYAVVTSTTPNPNWGTGAYLEVPNQGTGSKYRYAEVTLTPGSTAAAVDLMMGDQSSNYAPVAGTITICVSISTVGACDSTYTVTTSSSASAANEAFFGVTANSNIQSITFTAPAVPDSVLLDNFEYGEDDSAPEPLSALLMGSGLVLLGGRMARHRS